MIAVISCQKELKLEKESFNLKQNFTEISERISMNDTVEVFVDLSLFHHDFRSDQLKIWKSKDSLFVFVSRHVGYEIIDENGNKAEGSYPVLEKLESEASTELIVFKESKLFLKLDKLIQENNKLIEKATSFELPHLVFRNQRDTLQFNFSSKKDWKNFKYEYCQIMYNFSSYNKHYKDWGDTYFKDSNH